MAMNLAREGVEMMYTIRDTNWKKWSGERDNYRLMKDTFLTPNNDLLDSGLYYLQTRYSSGQSYPVLVKYPL
ncbi:MAG: hypothetical protein LBG59_09900 [Candidatus Peribacteria bacterium]|nr:hypothetical protein [Candidatus Peribacteria bacterium]